MLMADGPNRNRHSQRVIGEKEQSFPYRKSSGGVKHTFHSCVTRRIHSTSSSVIYKQDTYNHHHNNYYMALAYQRKAADGPWEDAVQLIFPPIPRYSIYYHKLAIDRAGNLYLSYNYYSTQELYESYQERYRYTSMLFSNDGGNTWSLARTLHFGKGIRN